MFSFIGYKCPVCGKPFAEGDDIVVCPDCGAPYHRECYHKLGRCQFESLHSPSFVWEPSPQEEEAAKAARTIPCPACGTQVPGNSNFCPNCGGKKPEPKPAADSWKCPECGAMTTGKFCPECGAKKPEDSDGWICSCGTVNKGKFCQNCGAKKPAGALLYRCDKCGWQPEDPTHPPKFCPECGDPFDDGDVTN